MLFQAKNIYKNFFRKSFFGIKNDRSNVLTNININIHDRDILGVVGETGSGKSTLGKIFVGLEKPSSGTLYYYNNDIFKLNKRDFRKFQKNTAFIFQDPYSSFNPRMKVLDILQEPLILNGVERIKRREIINEIIDKVELRIEDLVKFPYQFSGGQRQRIAIARSLILKPKFLVADEPVSSLDLSVKAQILKLFEDIYTKSDLTMMIISHDLSIVEYLCNKSIVLYKGVMMEEALTDMLFRNPLHPYTRLLIESAPSLYSDKTKDIELETFESSSNLESAKPGLCPFLERCKLKVDKCRENFPEIIEVEKNHKVRCFKYI
ncbi:dipeptide/oligopeptide/nickel transport system ATP-binding protein [Thermodesulfobium acidiphilum]|uniref:Dipeptide/oligopeptide/nickel transport system ATP-binding protein n=1 Tax=Thermodesulfobium acidiphilum TaxID=1794699 RepID=A0A2R4W0H0_THEAF|nr:ABC transporter ATP-binding protein [Thermodesulfobium acidiphilum]AWB10180.1 dipeptide/oligopeptide/nickel transport system ATP-binding protein [Thermodesulfobium acidiphilum]